MQEQSAIDVTLPVAGLEDAQRPGNTEHTSTWRVDSDRSEIEFTIKHLKVTTVRGRFSSFAGMLAMDEENPQASSVERAVLKVRMAPPPASNVGDVARPRTLTSVSNVQPVTPGPVHSRLNASMPPLIPETEAEFS